MDKTTINIDFGRAVVVRRTYLQCREDERLTSAVDALAKSSVVEKPVTVRDWEPLFTVNVADTLASLPLAVPCAVALAQVDP